MALTMELKPRIHQNLLVEKKKHLPRELPLNGAQITQFQTHVAEG
jgi:hypothetical protein